VDASEIKKMQTVDNKTTVLPFLNKQRLRGFIQLFSADWPYLRIIFIALALWFAAGSALYLFLAQGSHSSFEKAKWMVDEVTTSVL
jgi:hypothetical protein